jgi:hypothetical protein
MKLADRLVTYQRQAMGVNLDNQLESRQPQSLNPFRNEL